MNRSDWPSDPWLLEEAKAYIRARLAHNTPSVGEVNAWEQFQWLYLPLVREFALACGARPQDLDDLAQEIWLAVLVRVVRFEVNSLQGRFRTWLYSITRHRVADFYRRQGKQLIETTSTPISSSDDPAMLLQHRELRQRLRAAAKELKPRVSRLSYLILLLRWFRGQSDQGIAERLGLSPRSVHSHLYRAKKKLRKLLKLRGEVDYWLGDK